MRSFSCFYYKMRDDGFLMENSNNACWAGLNGNREYMSDIILPNGNKKFIKSSDINFDKENKDYIFISQFREKDQSDENIKRLLHIINNITPCKIVKINGQEYIKYKCIEYHYANLVLLNFIRKLWFKPKTFDHKQFFKDIFKDMRGKDSLMFLMTCLKNNTEEGKSYYAYGDHSNVYDKIIPKKKSRLFEYKQGTMESFMKLK